MPTELSPLAANLRRLRAASALSQQAAASRCGLSIAVFTGIERGATHNPHINTLIAIAGLFGVSVSDLLAPCADGPAVKRRPGRRAASATQGAA
jgi:transcriptional regulator with XRE-family HTH domain